MVKRAGANWPSFMLLNRIIHFLLMYCLQYLFSPPEPEVLMVSYFVLSIFVVHHASSVMRYAA